MIRLIVILTLVCTVAAFVLGITYKSTAPLIAAQKEKQIKQALNQAAPDADEFKEKKSDDNVYYEAYKNGQLTGYIIFANASGYSGDIEMMVGLDKNGQITGIQILSQEETPGLGARCNEIKYGEKDQWFTRQFKQKRAQDLSLKNIQAITGATITTEAVIKGVKESAEVFFKKIK
ncbi:MAG: RnfABCDGE type electron transport complex subunit G [Candidatus Omnitrophota bacterium]